MSTRGATVGRKAGGKTKAHHGTHERSRLRLTARAALVLSLVVILAMALVYPIRLYLDQQDQLRQMQQQTGELEQTNKELNAELARLSDPAYLEQLARACLGMVRRGETAFVVVPKDGASEPVPCTPTA